MLLTGLFFLARRSSYLFAACHEYVLKYKHNNWRLSDNLLPFCTFTLCIIGQGTQEFFCSVPFIFLHRFSDSLAHSIFICTISIDHTKRWAINDGTSDGQKTVNANAPNAYFAAYRLNSRILCISWFDKFIANFSFWKQLLKTLSVYTYEKYTNSITNSRLFLDQ